MTSTPAPAPVVPKDPPSALMQALARYGQQVHLIMPATDRYSASNQLTTPQITQVIVNADPAAGEVYKTGTKKADGGYVDVCALGKPALDRIAMACGVVWDTGRTGPVVSNRDVVIYRATGYVRLPDGGRIWIVGTKEIDMAVIEDESRMLQTRKIKKEQHLKGLGRKAGAEDFKAAEEHAKGVDYEDLLPDEQKAVERAVRAELVEYRKHRMARAETGAKKRAIMQLGLKSTYTPEELRKPFVGVRWGLNPDHEFARAELRALWGDHEGPMPANPLRERDAQEDAQNARTAVEVAYSAEELLGYRNGAEGAHEAEEAVAAYEEGTIGDASEEALAPAPAELSRADLLKGIELIESNLSKGQVAAGRKKYLHGEAPAHADTAELAEYYDHLGDILK